MKKLSGYEHCIKPAEDKDKSDEVSKLNKIIHDATIFLNGSSLSISDFEKFLEIIGWSD